MRECIKFWWWIAKSVWICLFIGWSAVVVSYVINWEFESSGGVLICFVIIAELFFNQRELYVGLERSTDRDNEHGLYLPRFFRRKIREQANKQNKQPWEIATNVRNKVHIIMAISLIIGTLVSGYGEYLQ
ncbi:MULTISPECIES: hypothetical protein [Vibrio]|uniref:hypothetical protein n=1 Tax=Vibrio TaxID=662 RepID=UPI0014939A90|nr:MULTISPECIES: hypothetical protein [Vibrio]MDH5905677.1 hypothetical protein [Vibrio splendidus]NOH99354.1 hypothetical protein [Vibrio sp. 99-70-13A1]